MRLPVRLPEGVVLGAPVGDVGAAAVGRRAAAPVSMVVFMVRSWLVGVRRRAAGSAGALRAHQLRCARTSVQYIQISDTQTTPYISMKAVERTPVRSISAPNMIGSTKPPRPPARPTMPEIDADVVRVVVGDVLEDRGLAERPGDAEHEHQHGEQRQTFRPTWKVFGPLTVRMVKSVCG